MYSVSPPRLAFGQIKSHGHRIHVGCSFSGGSRGKSGHALHPCSLAIVLASLQRRNKREILGSISNCPHGECLDSPHGVPLAECLDPPLYSFNTIMLSSGHAFHYRRMTSILI